MLNRFEGLKEIAKASAPVSSSRIEWLDGIKGIAILWIVFFHFFDRYNNDRYPWLLHSGYLSKFFAICAPSTTVEKFECALKSVIVGFADLAFHGVGVFIVLSGFGLTYSLARSGDPRGGWRSWYGARLLRLYPMYWFAHLVYLVSPFVSRPEPIDYRFLLSFIGDRIYPSDTLFYYVNPAWWYFGLLVELYLVFPILFRLLQRLGAPWFLVICALATVISRYVLLFGYPMNGHWVQGAFFGARLWEFAFGMVVGQSFAKCHEKSTKLLFSPITLIFGVAIYIAALYTYEIPIDYIVTDALAGTGLFIILAHVTRWMSRVRVVESAVAHVGAYSYGLYLLHQPYVIYIGERVRWMSFAGFLGLACILVPLLALGSIPLEQAVNRVTDLALARLRRPASSAAQPA